MGNNVWYEWFVSYSMAAVHGMPASLVVESYQTPEYAAERYLELYESFVKGRPLYDDLKIYPKARIRV